MKLRDYMECEGIKQSHLAHRIGVSDVTLRSWMRGDTGPKAHQILAIQKLTHGFVRLEDWVECSG